MMVNDKQEQNNAIFTIKNNNLIQRVTGLGSMKTGGSMHNRNGLRESKLSPLSDN